jgi:hypothetical protein
MEDDSTQITMINELALKTLEVFEIETIQREGLECSTQASSPN